MSLCRSERLQCEKFGLAVFCFIIATLKAWFFRFITICKFCTKYIAFNDIFSTVYSRNWLVMCRRWWIISIDLPEGILLLRRLCNKNVILKYVINLQIKDLHNRNSSAGANINLKLSAINNQYLSYLQKAKKHCRPHCNRCRPQHFALSFQLWRHFFIL